MPYGTRRAEAPPGRMGPVLRRLHLRCTLGPGMPVGGGPAPSCCCWWLDCSPLRRWPPATPGTRSSTPTPTSLPSLHSHRTRPFRAPSRPGSAVRSLSKSTYPSSSTTVEDLPRIQSYVNLLDKLATWLPLAALLLLAPGIWLAPLHRRAALIGAIMIAILMIVMLIALKSVRNAYTNEIANKGPDVPAALALYDTLLRTLSKPSRHCWSCPSWPQFGCGWPDPAGSGPVTIPVLIATPIDR